MDAGRADRADARGDFLEGLDRANQLVARRGAVVRLAEEGRKDRRNHVERDDEAPRVRGGGREARAEEKGESVEARGRRGRRTHCTLVTWGRELASFQRFALHIFPFLQAGPHTNSNSRLVSAQHRDSYTCHTVSSTLPLPVHLPDMVGCDLEYGGIWSLVVLLSSSYHYHSASRYLLALLRVCLSPQALPRESARASCLSSLPPPPIAPRLAHESGWFRDPASWS